MKLGLFSVIDHYPAELPRTGEQLLQEIAEQTEAAERLGFACHWIAEHHFAPYGLSPNPAVTLAYLAGRTQKIRLGTAISLVPLRNPVQVAEDYALLDMLSGGRLNLGIGSGYLKHEFEPLGIAMETKADRMNEAHEVIVKAFTQDSFEHRGRFWQYDGPVSLQVRPVQRPGPPLWAAILRREAAYHVGLKGLNILGIPYVTVGDPGDLKALIDAFRQGYAQSGRAGAPEVCMGLHVYVAETRQGAHRVAEEALSLYLRTRKYARGGTFDDLLANRLIAVGDPDDVANILLEYKAAGTDQLMCLSNFGGLPHAQVLRSLDLLARHVAPRLT